MAAAVIELPAGHRESDTHISSVGGLGGLVRGWLAESDEPDPHKLAEQYVDQIPPALARQMVLSALAFEFRRSARDVRRVERPPTVPRVRGEAARKAAMEWDVYRTRFEGANGWKMLGEFTREDAEYQRDEYERRRMSNAVWEQRFKLLARKVPKGKLVRDVLSREELAALLAS